MTAYDHAIYFFFKSHPLNKCQRKKKKYDLFSRISYMLIL